MKLGKNRKYRGTICCDIDGVLADFEENFCQNFGYSNRHLYSLVDRVGPELQPEVMDFIYNPWSYNNLNAIFGGCLFTKQAHDRGWYILLMTQRPDISRDNTIAWLNTNQYLLHYDDLVFTDNKQRAVLEFDTKNPDKPVRIVLDDSPYVLSSLEAEKYCVSWDSIWNRYSYPKMWYSPADMKLMMQEYPDSVAVGVWDKVGKK